MNFFDKLLNVDRRILYTILIVLVSAGLFVKIPIPTDPDKSSRDLYRFIQALPADKPVIVQTDWTNSTRGESMGHFENLLRLLMNKDLKFVFYSAADPIAPQVARITLARIIAERKGQGLKEYQLGKDYLDLGYFPNAEATNQSMGTDLRSAWSSRRAKVDGREVSIFDTDVLRNVSRIEDCGAMIVVTASKSIDVAVQRLSKKVPLAALVTGVMGPQTLPYHQSGQLKGVAAGLKGVYDMEYLAANGINVVTADGRAVVSDPENAAVVEPIKQGTTLARGSTYYFDLHVALAILVLAVVIGNVGMFMSRKRGGNQ